MGAPDVAVALIPRGPRSTSMKVYDLASGQELALIEHARLIHDIARSPDGKRIAGFIGGECRFFIVPRDELIAEAARRVGRNLSPTEWRTFLPSHDYRETFPGLPIPASDVEPAVASSPDRSPS